MAGVTLRPIIVTKVREIVESGAGEGFVSAAEFGAKPRLVRIPVEDKDGMLMDEALICLKERRNGKLVPASMDIARDLIAG